MNLNLQFFADEEEVVSTGENEVSVSEAEETTVAEDTAEQTETASEPESEGESETQAPDMNAIYAGMRRKAEAEAREKQAKIDADFARRFGSYKNPETGKPIQSQADYLEAIDAQERMNMRNELRSKGIDPSVIDKAIQNNPIIQQANQLIETQRQAATMSQIAKDVEELGALDPSIKSFDDVPKAVVEKCMQIKGLTLVDAYKLLNYGTVTADKAAAIKQSAINQARGKGHLTPVNGVATQESGVDIPADELATWKAFYPNLSSAELRKKYNQTL